jgi:hypothetical protein
MNLKVIFLLVAAILFVLKGFNANVAGLDLMNLGFCCVVISIIV